MKAIYSILFSIIAFQSYAQFGSIFGKDPIVHLENFDKQTVHWGYYLGFNSLDFKIDQNRLSDEIVSESTIGFNVGLVGDLRISNHLNLRFEPGLYYTQRNLTFPGFEDQFDALREVKSTYIFFPLLLKFSALRTGNIKPYLVGGVSTALNLSSNAKAQDDNENNRFRMIPWTNFYEVGFGIDIYLEYFKFSPSIRGVFSFNDELIRDNDPNSPWTSSVGAMKTRGFFINFTFH
jgi:hypothetical protein